MTTNKELLEENTLTHLEAREKGYRVLTDKVHQDSKECRSIMSTLCRPGVDWAVVNHSADEVSFYRHGSEFAS